MTFTVNYIASERDYYKGQRDELLAALKAAEKEINPLAENATRNGYVLLDVRAAIARAEGKAQS